MKILYSILVISLLLINCSPESDGDSSNVDNDVEQTIQYKYDIKALVNGDTYVNKNSFGKIEGHAYYLQAIDTLFINLNMDSYSDDYYSILGCKTSIWEPNYDSFFVENTLPHVNYIKFIDYNPSNHYYEGVYLQTNWANQKNGFTYSECNIDLQPHELPFLLLPYEQNMTIEVMPKRGGQITQHITINNFSIGEKIQISSRMYRVISKTQI